LEIDSEISHRSESEVIDGRKRKDSAFIVKQRGRTELEDNQTWFLFKYHCVTVLSDLLDSFNYKVPICIICTIYRRQERNDRKTLTSADHSIYVKKWWRRKSDLFKKRLWFYLVFDDLICLRFSASEIYYICNIGMIFFFFWMVERYGKDRAQTICIVCVSLLQLYAAIKYTASVSEENDEKKIDCSHTQTFCHLPRRPTSNPTK
jgi:uncharacterized CHY-type Zn-finger protein